MTSTPPTTWRLRWLFHGLCALVLLLWLAFGPPVHALPDLVRYRHAPAQRRMPVEGLALDAIRSTWHAPRSGGRRRSTRLPLSRATQSR